MVKKNRYMCICAFIDLGVFYLDVELLPTQAHHSHMIPRYM